CTLMFFIWWIAFDLPPFLEEDGRVSAFYRAMTLLVVASPCALVLSVAFFDFIGDCVWCAARHFILRGSRGGDPCRCQRRFGQDGNFDDRRTYPQISRVPPWRGRTSEANRLDPRPPSQHPLSRAI